MPTCCLRLITDADVCTPGLHRVTAEAGVGAVKNLLRDFTSLKDDFRATDPTKNPERVKTLLAQLKSILGPMSPAL
jgi:hypothetical protein